MEERRPLQKVIRWMSDEWPRPQITPEGGAWEPGVHPAGSGPPGTT